jgi:hypothetical protein
VLSECLLLDVVVGKEKGDGSFLVTFHRQQGVVADPIWGMMTGPGWVSVFSLLLFVLLSSGMLSILG